MNMTNKERLINVFNNRPADRVPVGFWFHFLQNEIIDDALKNPELAKKSLAGHKAYIDAFHPDFVKIMSDGFFHYPIGKREDFCTIEDLKKIKVCNKNDPWVKEQTELVKQIVSMQLDTAYFYNFFSPAGNLQWFLGDDTFFSFFEKDPEAVKKALCVISQGQKVLAEQVIKEGGADGVYYSVSNPDVKKKSDDDYKKYIKPSEIFFMNEAEKLSENNILHICGFRGMRNNLKNYIDYPGKAINWAIGVEKVSLAEGKKLFGGRAVIGGFGNHSGSLIHSGTKEEITGFTRKLIEEAGSTGVIIGADCTLPDDTPLEHFEWVRQAL